MAKIMHQFDDRVYVSHLVLLYICIRFIHAKKVGNYMYHVLILNFPFSHTV